MNSEMMKGMAQSTDRADAVVPAVLAIAREVGRSPAQVALAWLRQRPIPIIPIIGARKLEQFRDNLACLDLKLNEAQVGRLDAASHVELGFPHDFCSRERVKGVVYGGMRDQIDS